MKRDNLQQSKPKETSVILSLGPLLGLHFLPGGLVCLVYLATAGSLATRGIPPSLTLHLTFGVVGIPTILGLLRFLGKRETGLPNVITAIRFREHLRVWQYLVLVPGFLLYAILVSILFTPVTNQLTEFIG